MAKVKAACGRLWSVEWTARRVLVATVAALAFCLPFVGLGTMAGVLRLWWR